MFNNKSNITYIISSLAEEISLENTGVNDGMSNPDVSAIQSELSGIWEASKAYKANTTFNSQQAFNSFKDKIANLEPEAPVVAETKVVTLKSRYQYLTGIAATAALLIGAWFLYPSDTITYDNFGDSTQQFSLVDGSNLYLFPGASLEIGKDFSKDNRNLNLKTGQVVLDVESSKIPFIMSMDDNDIVVTGTKFSANFNDDDIVVNLYEGAINYTYDGKVVGCTQGTQLIHDLKTGKVDKINTVDKSLLDFANGTLSFINTPLEDVFTRLEQFYNVKFTSSQDFADDLHFTSAVLDDQSLESIIKTLEVSFNLDINQVDDSNYSIQF